MKENLLQRGLKLLKISLSSILILSFIALIYSLIKKGTILKRVFDFNYFVGSIIIAYGVVMFFLPIRLKKTNRLVDISNAADVIREEKDKKYEGAVESIFWGVSNILIVSIIEVIIRSLL